ncbi:MAG: tRNA (cytidine(34)-2'-O)-methyltransferase [Candidatus Delongbacteria bacterium]
MSDNFLNIVLYQPEIPYNTGNIGRLCVGMNSKLHLIEPLGFKLTDKMIRRAGLDYWDSLDIEIHSSLDAFLELYGNKSLYYASTKAKRSYYCARYSEGDYIIFGKESAGLPGIIHKNYSDAGIRIPMSEDIRSLNLCNSVALVMYEAYRQLRFCN